MQRKAGIVDEDDTSDSDISDSDDDTAGGDANSIPDGTAEDKQGPIDSLRDYKKRSKTLHRQHRGAMQWKVSSLKMTVSLRTAVLMICYRSLELPNG
jgi:hypothetical protein